MNKALGTYKLIEAKIFNKAQEIFSDDLLLYCVTGSLARKEIIDGWSDIDILLVLDTKYDHDFWKKMTDLLSGSYPIKIGCTFYSLEEFNGNLFKDPKTLHSISLIKTDFYKPRIISSKINLDGISLSQLNNFDLADFSKFIHELKRELLIYPNFDEKKTVKLVFAMMKIILRQQGERVYGYIDTAQKFRTNFPRLDLIITPEEIIFNLKRPEDRYKTYINFLNWVRTFQYAQL